MLFHGVQALPLAKRAPGNKPAHYSAERMQTCAAALQRLLPPAARAALALGATRKKGAMKIMWWGGETNHTGRTHIRLTHMLRAKRKKLSPVNIDSQRRSCLDFLPSRAMITAARRWLENLLCSARRQTVSKQSSLQLQELKAVTPLKHEPISIHALGVAGSSCVLAPWTAQAR